jgi:hypothetical protein
MIYLEMYSLHDICAYLQYCMRPIVFENCHGLLVAYWIYHASKRSRRDLIRAVQRVSAKKRGRLY